MSRTGESRKSLYVTKLQSHVRTPLYGNAYNLILSTGVTSALGILYWIMAAQYYTPESVGLNASLIASVTLASGLSRLNLGSVLIRFVPSAGQAASRLVAYSYLAATAMSVAVGLVFVLRRDVWLPSYNAPDRGADVFAWFVAAVVIFSIFSLQDSALIGLRRTAYIPLENSTFGLAKLALLLLIASVMPSLGIFISWTVAMLLLLLPVNMLIFRRLISHHAATTHCTSLVLTPTQVGRFVAGDYLADMAYLSVVTLLPIMVTQVAGAAANAYFYQPWLIASSLQPVAAHMGTSLTVESARDLANLRVHARRTLRHTARLLIPIVAFVFVAAPVLLQAFGSNYAAQGTLLLRLLALSLVPQIIVSIYINVARVERRLLNVVLAQWCTGGSTLTLAYFLLPEYGINGIGVAWLASQTLLALVLLLTRLRWLLTLETG